MTAESSPPLGPALSNRDELLWRQVNPHFVHGGRVSSQVFKPTPKDEGLLSVARSSRTTAEDAFHHHVKILGFVSAGVLAVSVGECLGESLTSYEQPLPDNPAHAVVDFRVLSDKDRERKAKRLAAAARSRGFTYQPGG